MPGRIAASVMAVAPEERGSQAGEVQAAPDRWLEGPQAKTHKKKPETEPTKKEQRIPKQSNRCSCRFPGFLVDPP